MNRSSRRRGAVLTLAGLFALTLAGIGCEDDTTPVITKLSATPQCGVMTEVLPGAPGNATQDTLRYLDVTFFARASSGNAVSDPTGANSPLDWRWDFDGNGSVDATNVVNPTFRYEQPGEYTARLVVEDDDGDTDEKTIVVEVRQESTDLDILTVAARSSSAIRGSQTGAVNNAVDEDGEELPLAELPLDERFVFDSQYRLDGWTATFDAELTTGCTVTELFSQFDWLWTVSDGTEAEDLNPIRVQRGTASFDSLEAMVTVREIVTGVERTSSTETTYPSAVIVRNGTYFTIAPDATDAIDVVGAFLSGTTELSFGISYDPEDLAVESVDTDGPLAAAGFDITVDQSTPGRIDFGFSRAAPYEDPAAETPLATITFRTADVTLEMPQLRPMRVRDLVAVRSDGNPPVGKVDGFIRADVDDCNDNGLGDTMELTARGTYIDITGEGVVDYCDDCDDSGERDGVELDAEPLGDIDGNGLPDECDCNSNGAYDSVELAQNAPDDDDNGVPDDCDCDWNGQTDIDEIRNGPGFEATFDPETGRVVSYVSDLDQFGGQADLVLDFCQDCDDNGELDSAEITIQLADNAFPEIILSKFRLDVDDNNLLDECDCDGSDRFDRGELERNPALDSDGDGLIDDCDCDDNGVSDLQEIAAGIESYDDLETNERPGSPIEVLGFRSNVDVNADFELDRCADCNGNGTQDGMDIAADPKLDIDLNGLPDTCDCNKDDEYDGVPTPEQDINDDGVFDVCDCDFDGVADLRQIAQHPSTNLIFDGAEVVGYTSDIDQVQDDPNAPDDAPTPIIAGADVTLDVCQDCDGNGLLDADEVSVRFDDLKRKDLDRNNRLDACDCNRNRLLDSVEIRLDPALDPNDDGLIDDCDCNGNGENDLVELGEAATFDLELKVYTGSPIDLDANLVLDECENAARIAPEDAPRRGLPVRTLKAGRR